VRRVSAGGDERPGHATRRQVIVGVPVPRGVRAGTDAGRTRAAEGHGRRLILCTQNRTDPISGFANNGDAPDCTPFAVLLFRTPLVLQSSAVLIGSLLLAFFSRRGKRMIPAQIVGWMVVAGMLVIGSDPDLMMSIGIYAEHRLLTSEGMEGVVSRVGSKTEMSPIVFPIFYFFSDTKALVPKTWATLDPDWLHGLLMLSWILVVMLFFFLGMVWVMRIPRAVSYIGVFAGGILS